MLQKKYVYIASLLILFTFTTRQQACAADSTLLEGGVKVRIAVARFGVTGRFSQAYGGWDIGGGLSDQLTTELIDTGQVIVVERAILPQVLREQELTDSKLVTKETAVQVGQQLGVDYLILGQVTEFDQKVGGGGGPAGWLADFFPKISGEFTTAHVGIDLRIIDTSTGEILHAHREGRAWEKALAVDVSFPTLTFGGDEFHKTPLGKATRKVIRESVQFVLSALNERLQSYSNWVGKVTHVEGPVVYINADVADQVQVGDRLSVFSINKVRTDPETDQVVGLIENPIGELDVISTKEKLSQARMIRGTTLPKKGDIVRFSESLTRPISDLNETLEPELQTLNYADSSVYLVLD